VTHRCDRRSVLAASLALALVALLVQRVARADGREFRVSFVTSVLIAAPLVVAVSVPAIGMWAMLVMELSGRSTAGSIGPAAPRTERDFPARTSEPPRGDRVAKLDVHQGAAGWAIRSVGS
jgi:hypothetical protein